MQCWSADGQHQSRTKMCSEFENNAISHTTFVGSQPMSAGLTIHVQFTLLMSFLYYAH